MAGWVKWEKDIETDPRFVRMVRKLRDTCHAAALPQAAIVTLASGALLRFWSYADTHIRMDDTLDLGLADIDDLVGVPGFAASLPEDWLRVIDDTTVELPGYQEHNGVEAKKRDLNQKRQERHRSRAHNARVTQQRDACVNTALPDQTRPDQKRPDQEEPPLPPTGGRDATKGNGSDLFAGDAGGPKRTPQTWPRQFHDQVIAAYHDALPELPAVRDWPDRRKRKLDARIAERVKAGKSADQVEYWQGVFRKVSASDFLCGRKQGTEWRCPGLEWLLEPKNFTKLIEGAYDNTGRADHGR